MAAPNALEEWRPILNAAAYEASSAGRIRKRINKYHPERRQFVVLKPDLNKGGYEYVSIAGKKRTVHRVIYETFKGELRSDLVVCHLDGNRTNNNPNNLIQATQRVNVSHKSLHGTAQVGSRHPMARMNEEVAASIKMAIRQEFALNNGRLAYGFAVRIARAHSVSSAVVQQINAGKTWRHVDIPVDGRA